MRATTYEERRGEIRTYFDRTAAEAWARLTSEAPVGRIRATVRAGRTRMRETLLDCLPPNLSGTRVLDAGCGTGALAVEAARRGAEVVAVDLSPTLIALAVDRTPRDLGAGHIDFRVGDFLDPGLGHFDHVIAMDSLIHYCAADAVTALGKLAVRTRRSIAFTFAPSTPALQVMHAVGRFFPRGNRAPSIEPVAEADLRRRIQESPSLRVWRPSHSVRVASGFYTSQSMEMHRP